MYKIGIIGIIIIPIKCIKNNAICKINAPKEEESESRRSIYKILIFYINKKIAHIICRIYVQKLKKYEIHGMSVRYMIHDSCRLLLANLLSSNDILHPSDMNSVPDIDHRHQHGYLRYHFLQ